MSEGCRVAIVLAAVLAGSPAAAAEPWPERLYNPQKAEDDLILPMPCGGAVANASVNLVCMSRRARHAV